MDGDSAASVLREKLKVALQDARNLFDEDLLDEKEFKDLKAHELAKYKEQLAALSGSAAPPPVGNSTPPQADNSTPRQAEDSTPPGSERKASLNGSNSTPLRTPLHSRLRLDASRPSPASVSTPPSLTHTPSGRTKPRDVLVIDANAYARLKTPPIFRRRSKNKRKILIPSAKLRALHGLSEEKTN